jgi:hypothetical protein
MEELSGVRGAVVNFLEDRLTYMKRMPSRDFPVGRLAREWA